MNEIEKRRLQLLQTTRKTYSEKGLTPAVHPRYRAAYRSIYGTEAEDEVRMQSTFVIRLVIAILLVVLFYSVDKRKVDFYNVNSQTIVAGIQQDLLG